jgi:aspartyl-tRNA(Asn)/glutamyl-tRNA(Gln) amidotransferase subunit C
VTNKTNDIDIAHLANLAKVEIDEATEKKLQNDINSVVKMISKMMEVDTTDTIPLKSPLDSPQRLRPDQVSENPNHGILQRGAPETKDGFFTVPRVIE